MREIDVDENGVCVSAGLLAGLLDVDEREVQALMALGEIASGVERGIDDDAGKLRLTFTHRDRRVRLTIDTNGRILKRTTIQRGNRRPGAIGR